jgi:hypothetical protein
VAKINMQDWNVTTVCTAKPANPRFRLQKWAMLDKEHPKKGDTLGRIILNAATSRFIQKELTALVDHNFITNMGASSS